MDLKTSVFATSNNVEKIIPPLQSRFFIANMRAYTYEQFFRINIQLLTSNRYNIDEEIARATSDAVWKTSRNIRDSIRIAKMSGAVKDVDWLVMNFLEQTYYTSTYQPKISADLAAASSSASLGSFTP